MCKPLPSRPHAQRSPHALSLHHTHTQTRHERSVGLPPGSVPWRRLGTGPCVVSAVLCAAECPAGPASDR